MNQDIPDGNETVSMAQKKRQFGARTVTAIGAVLLMVGFILGTRADSMLGLLKIGQSGEGAARLDFSSVQQVYDKLHEKYDGKVDAAALIDGAKKGMVQATGDPYSAYFTDKEANEFLSDLEGKFSGIGAELGKENGNLLVVTTLDDSPARKSGLLANDIIAKVNDQATDNWTIEQAVSKIRGDKGTSVKLTIVRGQELKELSITRDNIVNPSVKWEVSEDGVGYMRIARFAENDTITLARKAAKEFKDKQVKGVVLDVRGNGGGYLVAAQEIAGLWLNDKVVVQERRDDKVVETLRSSKDPILEGVPTVVLMDGGSASASEIVAGALHDNGAAKLVGLKTFGKGSVQEIVPITSGGQLKVTIAKWFTPNGKNISKEGIRPDVEVKATDDDLKNNRDPQKDRAYELVKS